MQSEQPQHHRMESFNVNCVNSESPADLFQPKMECDDSDEYQKEADHNELDVS